MRGNPAPAGVYSTFLQVRIASLSLLTFPLKSEELLVTVSEFGQFSLPAGIFSGSAALPTALFTSVPLPSFRIFAGHDNRTRDGLGRMVLVSPFKVVTNVTGNLSGVARQVLTFIPEPGGLALRITATLALVACGWLRARR